MPRDLRVNVGTGGLLVEYDHRWRPEGRHDAVLCIRRRDDVAHCAGQWSTGGGWLDFGEQPHEGVAREFKEEVGLDVVAAPYPLLAVADSYEDPERHVVVVWYAVYQTAPGDPVNVEPEKADRVEWLTFGELKDGRPVMPPLKRYLDTLEQGVGGVWFDPHTEY
jgi:8-oxo-dGTP pyrophosphatase MutT (NUDIX family)